MKTTIKTKKTGYGHFEVSVNRNGQDLGFFETTDSQLVDDIQEMNNDGFEHELVMHDTFEEVVETCISRLK